MPRQFQSARYLDEPLRPLLGLSIVQGLGALLGAIAAFGTWRGFSLLPAGGSVLTEIRIFAVAAVAVLVYFAVDALAGGRSEPFARQLWAYCRRSHRYAPSPLITAPQEDRHADPTGTGSMAGHRAVVALPVLARAGRVRRR